MATSGVITTNTKYGSYFWVKWEISGSQSISDNKTTIAWSCGLHPGEQYYNKAVKMSAVSIDGVQVYDGDTYSNITDYKDRTFASGTLELSHNADGTKSFTVAAFSGWLFGNGDYTAAAKSFTLPTIPRASTVSAPSTGTLGTALKITIDRKSANFTDKLYYKIGSKSAVPFTDYDGTAGTYSWTPPVSLATNAPNSTKLSATIICETYNGTAYVGRSECTVTLSVPAASVSAPGTGTLGEALAIKTTQNNVGLTKKLYYKIGSKSAVRFTDYDGTGGNYSWTPPVSLATNAPNSTKLAATIICETYNGTAYVGRSECTVTLSIPASVVPSLKVSVSDPQNVKPNYGGYFVQLRSKIAVTITGTGIQGSTIKAYSIKVGRTQGTGTIYTANAKTGTTNFLQFAGSAWVTCTVTDSRGRTATWSKSYDVAPYSVPTISAISATRCTQKGTASRTGEYGKVTFTAAITPLSNKNTAAYMVQYREYGGTGLWTDVTPTIPEDDKYAPQNITTIFPADTNKRYTVRVVATDAFSTSNSSMRDISASFALFHWAKSMLSVGIGRLCDKNRSLQIGLNTYIDGELHANQHLFMGGNATTDNGSNIHFKTTNVATNVHNVRIYGGVGSSTTALGVYDAKNEQSVASYDDVSGKLTLLGYTPANITISASGSYLKNFSGTAKHISALSMGILRVYGETNVAMPAGTTYDVASIGDHIPTSTYALSVYSLKNMDVRLSTSGIIQIRPKEDIPAGYGIYIAGIWIAS